MICDFAKWDACNRCGNSRLTLVYKTRALYSDKFSAFVLSARDAFWHLRSVTAGALGASFAMDDPNAVGSLLRPIVSYVKSAK